MQRMMFGDLDLSVIDPHERDTRYIYDEIFVAKIYEHPELRIPHRPLVMDVGGNIGLFSIWAHRRFQPRAIYSYEASPATFAYLEDNTRRLVDGEVTRMHLINRAVARRPGETLVLNQSPLVSGISTLLPQSKVGWVSALSESRELLTHEVTTTTVTAEIETHGIAEIDLLKIDVEGYFMEVLAGIAAADFARIRTIVMEVDYADEAGASLTDVDEMLRSRGYATDRKDLTFYAWRP